MTALTGRADGQGTARYAARFRDVLAAGHFRQTRDGLALSGIGLGSYLGEADDATDEAYTRTAREALRRGVNVLDTAINYRHMRSERALGRALRQAVEAGEVARDEVLVATKGGFIAFDGNLPADPRGWFAEHYLLSGVLRKEDVVAQCHAMTPRFLEDQLERSLANLGVATIDVYYLHNPETQLPEIGPRHFATRLGEAFGFLEGQVRAGRIAAYGLATWSGFRVPAERMDHLELEAILDIARRAGGPDHHLRTIQLPLNLSMTEALRVATQRSGGRSCSVLRAARDAELSVMCSAPLLQGKLARPAPGSRADSPADTPAVRALQFARSAPGVTTALVGMKSSRHLSENLGVAASPPLSPGELEERFPT